MFYWDQPFPLAGLVEFLRVLVEKKPFLVGLVDQVFQAAQNFVESFFLFDLCLGFFARLCLLPASAVLLTGIDF